MNTFIFKNCCSTSVGGTRETQNNRVDDHGKRRHGTLCGEDFRIAEGLYPLERSLIATGVRRQPTLVLRAFQGVFTIVQIRSGTIHDMMSASFSRDNNKKNLADSAARLPCKLLQSTPTL
jgi:hypothetical protein